MSSSIYQGLQSCLMEPHVLRLKLTPPKSNPSRPPASPEQHSDLSAIHSDPQIETHVKIMESYIVGPGGRETMNGGGNGVGGWSFLQALSGVYVSPPAMALSGKSLDMCTESLGSETGSDGSEFGGDEKPSLFSSDETAMSLFSSDKIAMSPSSTLGEKPPRLSRLQSKKLVKPSYPPPLTSLSGAMGVKMKPYREGGRLVLQAVSIPSTKPCFEVERGGGRLRLKLQRHCSLSSKLEEEEVEEGEEKSSGIGGRRQKGRRCGGGRKELVNWEPFLVST